MWKDVFKAVHDHKTGLNHHSYSRCLHILTAQSYWKSMAKYIRRYVTNCTVCQTQNPMRNKVSYLQPMPAPSRPMTHLIIDTVGPLLPSKENRYILTCICELSSFVIAKPVKNHTALCVAKFLLHDVFLRYGFCAVLRSDRGSEFLHVATKDLLKLLNISHVKSSSYRPHTQGKFKRQHRILGTQTAKLCAEHQRDWSKFVPWPVSHSALLPALQQA